MCRFSKRAALLPKIKTRLSANGRLGLSNYSETRYRSLRVISPRSRRGFIDVCALKRMGIIDAARPYSALLSMRSPVPELKDHVRSVSQRDSCGYPLRGARSSRPLSRRWRHTVQETRDAGTHSILHLSELSGYCPGLPNALAPR
jgi:hypothetical protein